MNINNPTTFSTPDLTLSTSNSSGNAGALRADDTILVYDTTVPATLVYGGSGATGSAAVSARRDHVHPLTIATSEVACRIYNDANQSIADQTATTLTYDQEYFDTDTLHNPASNPERITINEDGLYLVTANIKWDTSTTGDRSINIYRWRSGSSVRIAANSCEGLAGAYSDTLLNIVTIDQFVADDYLTCAVGQNSGGAINVQYVANFSPIFAVSKIVGDL